MNYRVIIKYWFPVVLWMGFIFLMSTDQFSAHKTFVVVERIARYLFPSISGAQIDLLHTIVRKSAHVTEYFISGLLLFRAFRGGSTEPRSLRWAMASLLVIVLIAASDEYHQSFVESRTASVVDVGIDIAGGILAQGVSLLWNRRRRRVGGTRVA
jgi:VanZ family protein